MKHKIIILLFICFIGSVSLWNIYSKDRSFSEQENRYLMQMPSFSIDRFISGDFTKAFEEYITDQFAGKTFWLSIKSAVEKMFLKKEHDGILFGKDDFLLERFEKPGEQIKRNTNHINYFANKVNGMPTYFILVPTSVEIYQDKLPLFATSYSQKQVIAETRNQLSTAVKMIDVYDSLAMKSNQYLYFRTDHHWTMRGAYEAYKNTAQVMGFMPYPLADFSIKTVSNTFLGTFYRKANAFGIKPDEIEVFKPRFSVSYQVTFDEQSTSNSLYEEKFLKKQDQYSFFLNGNHSLVRIASHVKNGQKLLVVKDSYAHIFVPFLANHFEEIHMVDLRYYHADLYAYIKEHEIDETLFLYNVANFSTDSNMSWLKQ